MAHHPPHLVMSIAWGYGIEIYQVFLASLRKTGYGGDIKILAPVGHTRPEAAAVCSRWNAELVGLLNMTVNTRGLPLRMSGERFNMYAVLCASYELCLAADFRDTLFQSNPFLSGSAVAAAAAVRDGAELIVPLESRVIGTCPHNSYFVRKCFGRNALSAIGNQTVACSGILFGTPAAFAVLRVIATLVRRCPYDKMSDQAALNHLLYMPGRPLLRHSDGRPLAVLTEGRGHGFVNTVGVFKGQAVAFERDHMCCGGVMLNADGYPSPIVHQYDRLLLFPSKAVLKIKAVEESIGVRPNPSWLSAGAETRAKRNDDQRAKAAQQIGGTEAAPLQTNSINDRVQRNNTSEFSPAQCCTQTNPEPGRAGRCKGMATMGMCKKGTMCPVACGLCKICMDHPLHDAYLKIYSPPPAAPAAQALASSRSKREPAKWCPMGVADCHCASVKDTYPLAGFSGKASRLMQRATASTSSSSSGRCTSGGYKPHPKAGACFTRNATRIWDPERWSKTAGEFGVHPKLPRMTDADLARVCDGMKMRFTRAKWRPLLRSPATWHRKYAPFTDANSAALSEDSRFLGSSTWLPLSPSMAGVDARRA